VNYIEAKLKRDNLELKLKEYSEKVNAYPKGAMGLTPDAIKFSEPYTSDRRKLEIAFKALQDFNKVFVKTYKKERQAEQMERIVLLEKNFIDNK
jgi:hypothetical protein